MHSRITLLAVCALVPYLLCSCGTVLGKPTTGSTGSSSASGSTSGSGSDPGAGSGNSGSGGSGSGSGSSGSGSSGSGSGTTTTSNLVLNAATFSGADASVQVNSCITAVIAAGGGTCDARTLGGYQQMSESIQLGNLSSVANHIGLTLLLPDSGTWIWNLTDGTSCGIDQFSSTSLVGQQPAGGGNRMILAARAGSNMDSIYCTDGGSGEAYYIRAEGFSAWNNQPGSTFASGVVHIRGVADQSSFTRIFAENYYGDVWHIDSACCGAAFNAIQGTSNGTTSLSATGQGGIPLTLGPGSVRSISISNSGFNSPGAGMPDIKLTGESAVMGVNFYNTYMEGNGNLDPTTAMVYIGPYVGPVHFFGGIANTETQPTSTTKAVFENHGFMLDVAAFEAINTTFAINDVTANAQVPVWSFSGNLGSIDPYRTKHP
jgi:hypothetical protein